MIKNAKLSVPPLRYYRQSKPERMSLERERSYECVERNAIYIYTGNVNTDVLLLT